MTTNEKLDLVQQLLLEIAEEIDQRAYNLKETDRPLYRMLTEGGSYFIKEMHKGLITSGTLNTLKSRLVIADSLLNKIKMRLIKLQQDHFVVVDDSPQRKGDLILHKNWNKGAESRITKCPDEYGSTQEHWWKVQGSTHSLEGVSQLNLSEIKSLIGEVDVEELTQKMVEKVFENYPENNHPYLATSISLCEDFYKEGYNQCLEDSKDKFKEAIDLIQYFINRVEDGSIRSHTTYGKYKTFIQSLQPKTEWEVALDENNKLKLV